MAKSVFKKQNEFVAKKVSSTVQLDKTPKRESIRFVSAVEQGLKDADEGRVLTSAQAKSRLGLKK